MAICPRRRAERVEIRGHRVPQERKWSMSETITHKIRTIIIGSHREGMDKHSASAEERRGKVYGHTTKGNLLDLANNFGEWIKEVHPEMYHKNPSDLRADLVREYLIDKAKTCDQNTLTRYRSELKKIGILISKRTHHHIDLSVEKIVSEKDEPMTKRGADAVPTRADMEKLLDYAAMHPSRSGAAVLLQRFVGIRVSEMSYRIRIDGQVLRVIGKGNKRYPDMKITQEIAKLLNSAEWQGKILDSDGTFKFPKPSSINTYLRRTDDKLKIERHSFHDLRRYHATNHYDSLRRSGVERGEAIKMVNVLLNHGSNRGERMLHESYVKDLW